MSVALLHPPRSAADRTHEALDVHRDDRAGAHLAEFRFRFGPEGEAPALVPVPRPAPGEAWTLAQTLQEVRLRKLPLVATSGGVHRRRRGPSSDAALDAALVRYAGPLRVWLRLGDSAAPWDAPGWDDATRLFAAWFGLLFEPPTLPLALHPGERVTDWTRFRQSIVARLADGPDGPHAARVSGDLASLYERFGWEAERVRVPEPRPSLAA